MGNSVIVKSRSRNGFDQSSLKDEHVVERHLKSLGKREEDRWTLGGGRVEFHNGCVVAQ